MMPALVELGVGGGGYCKELLKQGSPVWAYDTFNGFPVHTATDGENEDILCRIGEPCNIGVKGELESLGVICVQGIFPETFPANHPDSVSLVHVDMDTYISTEAALRLFHDLMIQGGMFLVHDYNNHGLLGVSRAVDEFMAGPHGAEYECDHYAGNYRMRKRHP